MIIIPGGRGKKEFNLWDTHPKGKNGFTEGGKAAKKPSYDQVKSGQGKAQWELEINLGQIRGGKKKQNSNSNYGEQTRPDPPPPTAGAQRGWLQVAR